MQLCNALSIFLQINIFLKKKRSLFSHLHFKTAFYSAVVRKDAVYIYQHVQTQNLNYTKPQHVISLLSHTDISGISTSKQKSTTLFSELSIQAVFYLVAINSSLVYKLIQRHFKW